MGRKSEYSEETATAICARLAAGEPITRICRDEEMPDVTTVYRWMRANETFREEYARAREDQADTLAEEIIEIADDSSRDTTVNADGVELTNHEVVARSRLRVDVRKWYAGKIRPKKYGDKVETVHSGELGLKRAADLTDDELAEIIGGGSAN